MQEVINTNFFTGYKLIMYGNVLCIKGNYTITSYSNEGVIIKTNNNLNIHYNINKA